MTEILPEDDEFFVPIMPDDYGSEFKESPFHKNIEDISFNEMVRLDTRGGRR